MSEQQHVVSSLIGMKAILIDEEFNCRGQFNKMEVAELAKDIEEKTLMLPHQLGLIQPVTIRVLTPDEVVKSGKAYGLVAGFRRYFAFEVLKRNEIPCVILHNITPAQAAIINLSENVQRKDLNILQEAHALAKLKALGIPRDHVAAQLSVSSGWVQTRYNLLDLPEEIQAEAASGLITQKQIKEIWSLGGKDKQFEAVRKIKDAKLRGDKASDIEIKKKKEDANAKKPRNRTEIFEMMQHIRGIFGVRYEQKIGAWCAGEIGTLDFLLATKEEAVKHNLSYTVPPTGTIFNGE